jgi:hypothetical protein
MANWEPLRARLSGVADRTTIPWQELDDLVGGLPASAYNHRAFWGRDRSARSGFRTTDVRVGHSVTFVRHNFDGGRPSPMRSRATAPNPVLAVCVSPPADVILVSCVKTKLTHPAPAQDFYVSPLFRKARAYAGANAARWFVLSAQHGLVTPDQILDPYDLRLSDTTLDYRRAWGERVVAALADELQVLRGMVVEIHAGAAYADPIRSGLRSAGAIVVEPLAGLSQGRRPQWYGHHTHLRGERMPASDHPDPPDLPVLVAGLGSDDSALSPGELMANDGSRLAAPGLYSWWVDETGARDLSVGLGHEVSPGLIYAGQAGATRTKSGKKSSNTLWGRISGMHLGGRHQFSTFRLTLGSILASAAGVDHIDELQLTAWMHAHLRVVAIVIADGDSLDAIETDVLTALDPPLNLAKMTKTPLRQRLSDLRRRRST